MALRAPFGAVVNANPSSIFFRAAGTKKNEPAKRKLGGHSRSTNRHILLSVNGANGELRAGGMTYCAAFSQRICIRQEVRRLGLRSVTSAARRGNGLHQRIDKVLWISNLIQAGGQILLGAIDVANIALLGVAGSAFPVHLRVEGAAKVDLAAVVRNDQVTGALRGQVSARVN